LFTAIHIIIFIIWKGKNIFERPFYVFSYDSNLLFERIQDRIKSKKAIFSYSLKRYGLAFNKAGVDGSAKANIEETGNDRQYIYLKGT
jgi:hypothetical protein